MIITIIQAEKILFYNTDKAAFGNYTLLLYCLPPNKGGIFLKKPEKEKHLENYYLAYAILRSKKELYFADSGNNGYGTEKNGTLTIQETNYTDTGKEINAISIPEYNKELHKNHLSHLRL